MTLPPFFAYAHASVSLLSDSSLEDRVDDLINFLRRKLSPEDLAKLEGEFEAAEKEEYEAAIRRVVSRLKAAEKQHAFAHSRLELRSQDLLRLPKGRRLTVLRNSSPVMLLVLFRQILHQSWDERFGDVRRSLALAVAATEVAEAVELSGYLSVSDVHDLRAEALAYLGNAQRINSDLAGAELSLSKARDHLSNGTGDRILKADLLMFLAFQRVSQGRSTEAAALLEREIRLRRLLGDEENLGFSLIQRGWIGSILAEPIEEVCGYFKAGLTRVTDPFLVVQATSSLADAFAREGFGIDALSALTTAENLLHFIESDRLKLHHRWTRGITYRALGDLESAERDLRAVRQEMKASKAPSNSAIVALDLACVCAAKGKLQQVKQLAEEALSIFRAERLEERALTAILMLQEAVETERATEQMAVAVVNFVIRAQHNKALRFEWRDE